MRPKDSLLLELQDGDNDLRNEMRAWSQAGSLQLARQLRKAKIDRIPIRPSWFRLLPAGGEPSLCRTVNLR